MTSFHKFDFKFSKEKIEFLDTLVYKDHDNQLQTTIVYLHAKSAYHL